MTSPFRLSSPPPTLHPPAGIAEDHREQHPRDDRLAALDIFLGDWIEQVEIPGAPAGNALRVGPERQLPGPAGSQPAAGVPGRPDDLLPRPGRLRSALLRLPGSRRLYRMTLQDQTWTLLRTEPDFTSLDFSQRFVGTISPDGNRIEGQWETSYDQGQRLGGRLSAQLYTGLGERVVMRLTFILAGAALSERSRWVMPIFGASFDLHRRQAGDAQRHQVDPENNMLMRHRQQSFHVAKEDHGEKFFVIENGSVHHAAVPGAAGGRKHRRAVRRR